MSSIFSLVLGLSSFCGGAGLGSGMFPHIESPMAKITRTWSCRELIQSVWPSDTSSSRLYMTAKSNFAFFPLVPPNGFFHDAWFGGNILPCVVSTKLANVRSAIVVGLSSLGGA